MGIKPMSSPCRLWILLSACLIQGVYCAENYLLGQAPPPPAPPVPAIGRVQIRQGRLIGGAIEEPGKNTVLSDAITFPTDRKAKTSLNLAEDFIKEQSWGEAARILQSLLEAKE